MVLFSCKLYQNSDAVLVVRGENTDFTSPVLFVGRQVALSHLKRGVPGRDPARNICCFV
jgi:hypothetical protein